ncbi:interleukin enhancer-binding factor 2-like isoform X2 [Oscarella lobularis]|uniref:interleukin enhancer-binding factor 2-like isoform X2 n=1 Tax=Oscarella lobularis TaxID=121494 RepID=UPI0033132661
MDFSEWESERAEEPEYWNPEPLQLYTPFDLTDADVLFPHVNPAPVDEALTEAIRERIDDLMPSKEEKDGLASFIRGVTTTVEDAMRKNETMDGIGIEEIRAVGSHRKGTILAGHGVGDVVVVFSEWPTFAAVEKLASRIEEALKGDEPDQDVVVFSRDGSRFTLACEDLQIVVYSCCLANKMRTNDDDEEGGSENQIASEDVDLGLAAIRHVRWMDENVTDMDVKLLARLLKDIRLRVPQLSIITSWQCEVLAHHLIYAHPRAPLPIGDAFRRFFSIMAAGFFLPDSTGIADPCEDVLTPQQQEEITATCGALLRLLAMGGHREILGHVPDFKCDFSAPLEYRGIQMVPTVRRLHVATS